MNTGHRTIVSLLAVVAVLLGLNLIVGGLRPAAAQEPERRIVALCRGVFAGDIATVDPHGAPGLVDRLEQGMCK